MSSVNQVLNNQSKLVTRAIVLSLGAAVALGLARFNYALLLPAMRSSLDWTYAQAGGMTTANALGYLFGAILAAPIAARVDIARCFWISLLITGISLISTGLTDNFNALLILRFLAGFSGAVTFIMGATLASHLASGGKSGLVLGLYFGGVGIGIFLAGLGLPQLLENDAELWRQAWMAMGILTLLFVVVVRPVANSISITTKQPAKVERRGFPKHLLPSLLSYFLFGLGFISYMTFVISFLNSSGVASWALSIFWLILGSSTFLSAFVWRRLLEKAEGGHALIIVLGVVMIGATIPLISTSLIGIFLSAILFGGAFLSVVAAVMNIVRVNLPAHAWPANMALFTVFFSIGQSLGPIISGELADRTNSLTSGFTLSVISLFIAIVFAFFQKRYSS